MRYEVDLSEASKFARTPAYGIPVIRAAAACGPDGGTLGATNRFLTRDGSPWIPIAGEMHYSRIAAERWDTELAKMAAAGIDVVSTYVFWNHHEEREGEWDFSGNRNVRRFVELCARHGLHVIVRLGPFCHGEVRNGGLPDWLYGKSYEGSVPSTPASSMRCAVSTRISRSSCAACISRMAGRSSRPRSTTSTWRRRLLGR